MPEIPRRLPHRAGIAVMVGAMLVGSGLAGAVAGASHPAATRRIRVVAAFYPLAYAAAAVGGKHVAVTNLTPAGAEPHDLELTTDQVDALQDAALVVVMGRGFQPAVEKIAKDRDGRTLEILDDLAIARGDRRVAEGDPRALDPHVWLDPTLMQVIVGDVRDALARVDPAHAEAFAANAERLDASLTQLDSDYGAALSDCPRNVIVTAHEAFGYLAARYGLRQEGIAGFAPDAEPSAARLAELSDLAERKGVTTVFTEALVSPRLAHTLAREAGGMKIAVLNPLEGLTEREAERGDDYVRVMRDNLAKIARALGCPGA